MNYAGLEQELKAQPRTFLVTGAAGFIGSHLVERLLHLGQSVVGLDDFSTGHRTNVDAFVGDGYRFVEGDIRDPAACQRAVEGVEVVLHQAALGSVPRSIDNPQLTHAVNVDGFLNMLVAARDAGVTRFVYASSSSVYGDHPQLPKVEDEVGAVLSPYAASKKMNEIYADVFARCYGFATTGLRYFNVFGPRQDPNGPYAAVIPRWLACLKAGEACAIYGDGETSRDFCYVENAVQANLLSAFAPADGARVLNVAVGDRTTLTELHAALAKAAKARGAEPKEAVYQEFRDGDVRHSLADVSRAKAQVGFVPAVRIDEGIDHTVAAFWEQA